MDQLDRDDVGRRCLDNGSSFHILNLTTIPVLTNRQCAMIKETYTPSILKAKAAKMRKETGDDRYWCRYDNHMSCQYAISRSFDSVLTFHSGTTFQSEPFPSVHTVIYRANLVVLEFLHRSMFEHTLTQKPIEN
jgi:hypothetical protein